MRRVVVIGLDGLSWNVLEELFSRGVMSNVDAFRKKGVHGRTRFFDSSFHGSNMETRAQIDRLVSHPSPWFTSMS